MLPSVVLSSQRARPHRLEQLGFVFSFPSLTGALADIATTDQIHIGPVTSHPDDEYVRRWPPRYELQTTTTLEAPLEETFAFFSSARIATP